MSDEDIDKIRDLLNYLGRNDISELLSQSSSNIELSRSYGSKLNSILSTFEIYSSFEFTEKLRKLSMEEKNLILKAIREIYPVKDNSPEIVELKFYINSSKNADIQKLDKSFWHNIHSNIIKVSKKLFDDRYYAEAVFSAFKEVNIQIKEIYKKQTGEELDGKSLMMNAFNLNKKAIQLTNCRSETDRNIQEGYMYIFAGSMQAIRNPKAHDHIKTDELKAIHLLYLASLLMYKIDERIH